MTQMVKRLPAMWETQVQSLGWEDLLEKEMATHSSILAWKIPWTEEPGRLLSMGSQRLGHNRAASLSLSHPYTTSLRAMTVLFLTKSTFKIIVKNIKSELTFLLLGGLLWWLSQ